MNDSYLMTMSRDNTQLTLKESDRNFLSYRLSFISQSTDTDIGKFLYRTKAHFIVAFIVGCEPHGIDFETIFRKYNDHVSLFSRSTVQNILNSGVFENFFIKIENSKDRRRKNYFLSLSSIHFLEKEIKDLRSPLSK